LPFFVNFATFVTFARFAASWDPFFWIPDEFLRGFTLF